MKGSKTLVPVFHLDPSLKNLNETSRGDARRHVGRWFLWMEVTLQSQQWPCNGPGPLAFAVAHVLCASTARLLYSPRLLRLLPPDRIGRTAVDVQSVDGPTLESATLSLPVATRSAPHTTPCAVLPELKTRAQHRLLPICRVGALCRQCVDTLTCQQTVPCRARLPQSGAPLL